MITDKKELRARILAEIEALPAGYISESDEGIFENLRSLPQFKAAETIFSYYSLGREPDTLRIIRLALEMGKTVTLPVCFKGGIMEARAVESLAELEETRMGLLEPLSSTRVIPPEALDFVIVPALTFDLDGYRLGRGGGYYDRFLSGLGGFAAGVARDRLVMKTVPREQHDLPVNCVVTENQTRFRSVS